MYVRGLDLAYILQDDFEKLKQTETYIWLKKAVEYIMHFLPRKYIPNPDQKVMKLHNVMTVKRKMR